MLDRAGFCVHRGGWWRGGVISKCLSPLGVPGGGRSELLARGGGQLEHGRGEVLPVAVVKGCVGRNGLADHAGPGREPALSRWLRVQTMAACLRARFSSSQPAHKTRPGGARVDSVQCAAGQRGGTGGCCCRCSQRQPPGHTAESSPCASLCCGLQVCGLRAPESWERFVQMLRIRIGSLCAPGSHDPAQLGNSAEGTPSPRLPASSRMPAQLS